MKESDYIKNIPNSERRFAVFGLEKRESEGEKKVFRGYAAKFNADSNDLGGFVERIAPGFFDGVLGDDVRVLKNHNPDWILGRTVNGTARIGVDEVGLWYEYDDPETSYSEDLAKSIVRGDINQSSFAFTVMEDTWDKKDGKIIRTLLKAGGLYDVSPVTYPAYNDTSVSSRALSKLQSELGGGLEDLAEMEKDIMEIEIKTLKTK